LIDPKQLLTDLQKLLKRLEPDIRSRCESNPDIDTRLRGEYQKAKSADRTSQAYEVWLEDYITQVAASWILGCVFVRFLEDNRLTDVVWLAGPDARLQLARDQHTIYFQANPTHSDREYLEHVFQEVAGLPSMRELLDGPHNPISKLGPTGDGARELLEFWHQVEPSTGAIIHDFTDSEWSTRFLGDLYQDLSESARDRYALLQTPEFVEEFILNRTLTPAIEEFGYSTVKLIDPACGSGHFLLGAFRRLLDLRLRHEPGIAVRAQVEAVLGQIFGVDVNPFAVAIARFRLLVAALKASCSSKLTGAPGFQLNVAAGDSLLHGPSPKGLVGVQRSLEDDPLQHHYDIEDGEQVREFLSQQYHVVVGNPPYITVKDQALNQAYRTRFQSCHGKYSLAVPFKERFFDLAIRPEGSEPSPAGFVGMITANSFMKREFGKKLIEEYIPRWDLTHVIDTSGAYIPGHGTPTVILFGRQRHPVSERLRVVMGIRGEPLTPEDAANGRVWTAILQQIDTAGSESEYVSVADLPRAIFGSHPWSIGGGGASDLKNRIEEGASTLDEMATSIGIVSFTLEDDLFHLPADTAQRQALAAFTRPVIKGELLRDWSVLGSVEMSVFPYDAAFQPLPEPLEASLNRYLWPARSVIARSKMFGSKAKVDCGLKWYEFGRLTSHKLKTPLSIAYSEIASHNHFLLNRGGTLFDRTAPIIKLSPDASTDEHLAAVGLLNSSTACFWMKQVAHQKQMTGGDGVRVESRSKVPYQYSGTQLGKLPIPPAFKAGWLRERLIDLTRRIDALASELSTMAAEAWIRGIHPTTAAEVRSEWQAVLGTRRKLRAQMVWIQEEIDFTVYSMFGIGTEPLHSSSTEPPAIAVEVGQRPFELLAGTNEDGFEVPAEIPVVWPEDVRRLWHRRMEAIKRTSELKLVEDPHYKRRWIGRQGVFNHARCTDEFQSACRGWLLRHLDESGLWSHLEITSAAKVSERLQGDVQFRLVAELFRGRPDFDMTALVTELVDSESVPLISAQRYTETGLRKRSAWNRTWDLQRREDAIDAEVKADSGFPDLKKPEVGKKRKADEVGEITVPPKYDSKDFQKSSYWTLRGKLDVSKERFISFPHCERDIDPTSVIGWAGWNYLQQAQAIAAYYERVKNHEGWTPQRRAPLLTGILELIPWLKQWHNEIHPEYHERMGDFFQQFVEDEARAMEMTLADIRTWTPPVQSRTRGRKKRIT
jgi:hypothetical protein